jgi:hypothetical protein
MGLRLFNRMVVIRLRQGDLLVHSPIPLDDGLRAEIEALGAVRHLVAPNLNHHAHVGPWRGAFPDALLYAVPGLADKRPDLNVDVELTDTAPEAWVSELEQVVIGTFFYRECLLHHAASGSLIMTDTTSRFEGSDHGFSRFVFAVLRLFGDLTLAAPVALSMLRSRRESRAKMDRVLTWDIDRLVPAHGIIIERDARGRLRKRFRWL